jgi:spore maturation protein CgeB
VVVRSGAELAKAQHQVIKNKPEALLDWVGEIQQRFAGQAKFWFALNRVAVRALAFKWIRILFVCWQERIPYDATRYLQALQNRGSAYAGSPALNSLQSL